MQAEEERKPGAIVVGGDYQGLGIVRSLGRHNVPVCVIDDEHSIARYSRYCTRFVRFPGLENEASVVEGLLEIGKRLDLKGWVLYPTRDEHVAAFSRHRSELSQLFRVPTPSWDTVKWACDKRNTYRLAQQLSIPVPSTEYLANGYSAEGPSALVPPLAIKPAIKEHFVAVTKEKAWYAKDRTELEKLLAKAAALVGPEEIMVQEVIPGTGIQQYSYCAFFANGHSLGKVVARRLRQHPLQFGRASTYVETIDSPVVEELSERFLRAIDYYGLVEIEYKLDPRNGQFKLLDVNARTWGYHTIGVRAGVDFSYLLYRDQLGLSVPESKSEVGVRWIRTVTDLPAAFLGILARELTLKSYLRSLRDADVEAVFSRDDPLPGLAEILLIPYAAVKRGF